MTAVSIAQASTISAVSYEVSSLFAGAVANHTLVFTTLSGANEGSTMTLEFDSGLTVSFIEEDDVDIKDDGTNLSTASDCLGSEKVAISRSSQTLTMEICSGDGGAIAAGSIVQIDVGTQASFFGTGTHQITNPSSVQTVFITVAGTFADRGSIALPITSSQTQKSVSATVSNPSPSGSTTPPSSGGGSSDRTAPEICCVVVADITETSARVAWKTDDAANSFVDYGITDAYEKGTESQETSYSTSHSISLLGLASGTTYNIQVRSKDPSGNEDSASDYVFTTLDETEPVISNIQVIDISDKNAVITWSTNEPANSSVSFGQTIFYGQTQKSEFLTTTHRILLENLQEDTLYHFSVSSSDAFQNTSISSDQTFQTEENLPPANVSDLSVQAGDTTLLYKWTNPDDEDVHGVQFWCDTQGYPKTYGQGLLAFEGSSESFFWTARTNNTTYYCTVYVFDWAGQFSSGALIAGTPFALHSPLEEEDPTEKAEESDLEEQVEDNQEQLSDQETETQDQNEEYESNEDITEEAEQEQETPENQEQTGQEESEVQEPPSGQEGETQNVQGNTNGDMGEEIGGYASEAKKFEAMLVNKKGTSLGLVTMRFLVAKNQLELLIQKGKVSFLPNRTLHIDVTTDELEKEIDHIQLAFGSQAYLLQEREEGNYQTDILTQQEVGIFEVVVSIFFQDGSFGSTQALASVQAPGRILFQKEKQTFPVSGTEVVIIGSNGLVWDGSLYGEQNPVMTQSNGELAWYVPNGTYMVRAKQEGFQEKEVRISVVDHVLTPTLFLEEKPLLVEEIAGTFIQTGKRVMTTVSKNIVEVQEVLQEVRAISQVHTGVHVVTPVVATSVVVTTAVLVNSFSLLPFLQYILTSPILFWKRRKRKGYGMVYNAITKLPIDLAIVRLYRKEDNKLIQSRVTDRSGRFFFLVQPGQYLIKVIKPSFVFPTAYLANKKQDLYALDLYHGESLEVRQKNVVITPNIPLDPQEKVQTPSSVRRMNHLRFAQRVFAGMGVFVAAFVVILEPGMLTVGLLVGQLAVHLLVKRLAIPSKPKSWGIVYDKETGRPLQNVVVRLFEPKYNKLLETFFTDTKGRYAFLVGANEYFTTYDKEGYTQAVQKPIDYTNRKEPGEIALDVSLVPK